VRFPKVAGFAFLITALLVACGGSPVAPTVGPGATPTVGPGATPAPIATPAPNATPTAPPAAVTNPPVGGTIDPCSLLTPAELDAALGETYVAGVFDEFSGCTWNIEGETGNTGDLVVAYVNPEAYSTLRGLLGVQEGSVELTVGGREAFYNPTQGLTSLWVDIGGPGTLVLSFPQSNDLDPSYQAIAVQLAEIALSRL